MFKHFLIVIGLPDSCPPWVDQAIDLARRLCARITVMYQPQAGIGSQAPVAKAGLAVTCGQPMASRTGLESIAQRAGAQEVIFHLLESTRSDRVRGLDDLALSLGCDLICAEAGSLVGQGATGEAEVLTRSRVPVLLWRGEIREAEAMRPLP